MFLIGTSGWSYDEWVGPVYPPVLRNKQEEWLTTYGQRFPTVEVNSTFYRLPSERTVQGWIEKAEAMGAPFEFSVKVPQDVTHEAMVKGDSAKVNGLLGTFKSAVVEPLVGANLFGVALFQLSPHFRYGRVEMEMLGQAIAAAAPGNVPVAVEFRHQSWLEGNALRSDAEAILKAHDTAYCALDGPSFPPIFVATARHAYIRFHGRRGDVWFDGRRENEASREPSERYDYLYSIDELTPWAMLLREKVSRFDKIRLYFNNHVGGKAAMNGGQMMEMLGVTREKTVIGRQAKLDSF